MSIQSSAIHARATERLAFNFEFPIFLIISALLTIFFLLYFNRLFASIVSYGIRAYTWHRYRIYIDIKALQISLLGGRVFFTGLRYHGSNETFLVQHGSITWCYWHRRVREVDIRAASLDQNAADAQTKNDALPCRVNVKLVGLEWFVYNRSPAYDTILEGILDCGASGPGSSAISDEKNHNDIRLTSAGRNAPALDVPIAQARGRNGTATAEKARNPRQNSSQTSSSSGEGRGRQGTEDLPFLLQFFPIQVDCQNPALVVGNETTKAILIVKAGTASAIVDASASQTCDQYRQIFKVRLDHPVVEMKENEDFKEDQVARVLRQQQDVSGSKSTPQRSFFKRNRRKILSSLRNMTPYWRRSVESFSTNSRADLRTGVSQIPGSSHWQGLSRYLDDQYLDDKARWTSIEYGAVPTILDSPEVVLTIQWDVVSKVTESAHFIHTTPSTKINGSEPPLWAVSVAVKGGTMSYGPWADRQRADLQRMFFPTLAKDARPADPLPVGAWRVPTQFSLFVELEDTVLLRIPTREESKNWRWRGKEPPTRHHGAPSKRKDRNRNKKSSKGEASQPRPTGWLEVKVPANATISHTMDMLATSSGFQNRLEVDFPSTELRSSVNHDLLWKSGPQRISCDLGNPLAWNTIRNWHFAVDCTDLELFLLRDHVFLLTDLVDDWATGPPPDYLVFTPFKYHLQLSLRNPRLYLNVNDENIIDKATSLDDNTYLVLSSPILNVEATIPLDIYRPSRNAIPFDIRAETLDLSVNHPHSSTQAAFLPFDKLGHADGLTVSGNYQYNASTSPANTDTLVLKVHGQSPSVHLYGVVIRYFLLLKDNYFGDHVHFKTLDEYQEQLQAESKKPGGDPGLHPPHKKSNDLDVVLSVKVEDPRVILPAHLYSAKRGVQLELADLSVDLRFTNYFMDLEFVLSPLSISLANSTNGTDSPGIASSSTQLFIDGLRIFGHRTFGLPPSEPTYLCNWDVNIGPISGECTTEFLTTLIKSVTAFASTFDDLENALVPYSSLVFNDVTFVRAVVDCIHIWIRVEESAFLFSTDTIEAKANDWARSHYSKRADISIPNLQVSCVNAEAAARQNSRRHHPISTQAFFRTDIRLSTVGRKFNFMKERKIQQDLVRREDQRTNRTPFLLIDGLGDDFVPEPVDPPAQCFPLPPLPISETGDDGNSSQSTFDSRRSHRLKHKSSFLSLSSSSGSIHGARNRDRSAKTKFHRESAVSETSHAREYSRRQEEGSMSSPKHHLNTQAALDDRSPRDIVDHSSVAFSSQYFAPHFPLENVHADESDAPDASNKDYDDFFEKVATLDDIDPSGLSEEHTYSSVIIDFPSGLTACIGPEAVRHVNTILADLQSSEPEDILDSLQIGIMDEIADSGKPENLHGKVQDLLVKLPKADVRFLNLAAPNPPNSSRAEEDQYDMRISNLVVMTRRVIEGPNAKEPRASVYVRMKSAEISASERIAPPSNPQAAIKVEIDDVLLSIGTKDVTYFDADIGSVTGSTASDKIDYLASLIYRTGRLASELQELFSATSRRHNDRVRYVTYRLLQRGELTNDPAFLTRPSPVLRTATQHLRTCDSWKLIVRLRQILASLSTPRRSLLEDDCHDASCLAPSNALDFSMEAFQKWRSWDLEDPANSMLLKRVFGTASKEKETELANELPLLGACRLADLRLILDPGPKQNSIAILDTTLRMEKKLGESDDEVPGLPDYHGQLMICNICCGDAAIVLNWELCELADDILRLYNRTRSTTSDKPKLPSSTPSLPSDATRSPALHVVCELMRGSIELDTLNLNLKTLSSGLKSSVLMYQCDDQSEITSALVNCSAITSVVHSHSQMLGTHQLQQASVFVSQHLQETKEASMRTIKSTASSRELTLAIKEDPVVLLEVADLVVRDEAAQLYRLQSQIPSSPKIAQSAKITDRLSKVKINAAMFLDKYSISVPLLQTLTYKVSGVVAQIACAANFGKEVIVDFDAKENSHEMQIDVRDEPHSISLLQIPPMNGRITSHMGQPDHALTVQSSIEVVKLDASAIYSILAALNRPQISTAIEEIQQQSQSIQRNIAEIFGPTKQPSPVDSYAPRTTLKYDVHLTLAGLRIFTKAALTSKLEPVGQILFSLDKTYLLASNQRDSEGPPHRYPDLHVNLRKIGLDVRRGKGDDMRSCGKFGASVTISASSRRGDDGKEDWHFNFRSDDLDIKLSPETVSTVIDVIGYLSSKIRDLDTSRELEYLRKLRQSKPRITLNDQEDLGGEADILDSVLSSLVYQFELRNIRMCWEVAGETLNRDHSKEDLVLSINLIEFGTRTRKSARLTIESFLLQTVPPGQDRDRRSAHSALLPEVMFNAAYVSTADARRMAFQATGESLDLRLTSAFIVPAANLVESISLSMRNVQKASAQWTSETPGTKTPDEVATTPQQQRSIFGNKRLESLLIDADFAGAVVYVSPNSDEQGSPTSPQGQRQASGGRFGQFNADDSGSAAVLRSPGLAWKTEYRDNGLVDPSLYGEIKIDASSNILYPAVVPLVLGILSSVKEVVSDSSDGGQKAASDDPPPKLKPEKSSEEDNILTVDPSAVLGRLKLNLGLRISRQEFSLSCQPVARVAATTSFENVYFTVNTVTSHEHGNFFAISGTLTKPQASVQHVYSRESTASFDVDTVTVSFMNSKHFSGTSGVSAILKVSPMKVSVNAKQLQDFLLFREIWYPEDLRSAPAAPVAKLTTETSQGHLVQRYQQVAATAAFPWTATIAIASLDVHVDLGQAIGKTVFQINDLWASSKKTSDWEQNLCIGFQRIGIDCTGRLSGFIALQDFKLRTSIKWPQRQEALNETPLIQASLAFNACRVKAAFDYQAFLVADITSLKFLMYNVREKREGSGDRLVAIFDGEAVQVFVTTASAAQAVALWQALQKLVQERKENFETSLQDIEKFTRRKSSISRSTHQPSSPSAPRLAEDDTMSRSPISLDTDVVVTLKTLNLGVFPSTFSDHQVFKMEALDAYARFAASMEQRRIHSILRMTLGQLRIGLAGVRNAEAPKTLSEMTVEDVVSRSTGSRGGTILKVPRVEAAMETWQRPKSNHIDYVFKSAFEGKVEVGWNYSRISYIRGMWASHSKSLEQTWGRQLPMTAVKITGVPELETEQKDGEQQKITAEVNMPQSKYEYTALEPPVIETPQLRDMGEATPPLEWIGLHRDKLPNLTHQIVIVALLELAGEVEDAYSKILGSS